jgi:hypothetical protein
MQVQYRITEENYAAAVPFHAWRHSIASPWQLVAAGMMVAGGITILGVSTHLAIASAVALGVTLFAVLFVFNLLVRIPFRARRQYRKYKAMQEPIWVELVDTGVRFANSDGDGILSWSKILQWRQNDQFILIYSMPILFHIVPKSITRDGFNVPLLLNRLVEHVGAER